MSVVNAIRFSITGLPHESGLCTLHVRNAGLTELSPSDAGTAMTLWLGLINAMGASIPSSVTWAAIQEYKAYDVATSHVTAVLNATGVPSSVTGSGNPINAAGAGMRVNCSTSTIRGTRFVRGAWFLVPLAPASYDTTGEVSSSTKSAFLTAAGNYATNMATAGLVHVIYARPRPKGSANGVMADVTGMGPGASNALLHKRS